MQIKLPTWRHFQTPNWRRMINVFDVALELKDPDTQGHQLRVEKSTVQLGRLLRKLDKYWDHYIQQCAGIAARHHDMGKVIIDNAILSNRAPNLTPEQKNKIRRHPEYGEKMLENIFPPEVLLGIRHHHERWDGMTEGPRGGYPDGLAGDAIPPIARALHISDAYDAITSKRSYKPAIPKDEAVAIMMAEAGKQFDPDYVKIFCERVVPRL